MMKMTRQERRRLERKGIDKEDVYTDYWGDEYIMCSSECVKEWHDETCDPEVE